MLIESIIRRTGGSDVTIGTTTYHFGPAPHDSRHTAQVINSSHIAKLLAISGSYQQASAVPTDSYTSLEALRRLKPASLHLNEITLVGLVAYISDGNDWVLGGSTPAIPYVENGVPFNQPEATMGLVNMDRPRVFTPSTDANWVPDATVKVILIASGVSANVPSFGGGFVEDKSNRGFDNTGTAGVNGVPTTLLMWKDESGLAYYSMSQNAGSVRIAVALVPAAPAFTSAVSINAPLPVGVPATYAPGTVTGYPIPSTDFTFVLNGVDVGPTYTPVFAEIGRSLQVRETASNIYGDAVSLSDAVVVAPQRPGASTNVVIHGGGGEFTVTFDAPASNGGSPITQYAAQCYPSGVTGYVNGPGAAPIRIQGVPYGVPQTVTVYATNAVGDGPGSVASAPYTLSQAVVEFFFQQNVTKSNTNNTDGNAGSGTNITSNYAAFNYTYLPDMWDGEYIFTLSGVNGGSNGAKCFLSSGQGNGPYYTYFGIGFSGNNIEVAGSSASVISVTGGAGNDVLCKLKRRNCIAGPGKAVITAEYWNGSAWVILATLTDADTGAIYAGVGTQETGGIHALVLGY